MYVCIEIKISFALTKKEGIWVQRVNAYIIKFDLHCQAAKSILCSSFLDDHNGMFFLIEAVVWGLTLRLSFSLFAKMQF